MKIFGFVLAGLMLTQSALADVIPFDYRLGATPVTEDAQQILIHATPAVSIAIQPGGHPSPYLLVHSADGGQHWRNLAQDDPLLSKVPAAWLEGQKRRVMQP